MSCRPDKIKNCFVMKLFRGLIPHSCSESVSLGFWTKSPTPPLGHRLISTHNLAIGSKCSTPTLNDSNFVANMQTVWLPSAVGSLIVLKYVMTSFLESSLMEVAYFKWVLINLQLWTNSFFSLEGPHNVKISLASTVRGLNIRAFAQ